MPRKLLFLALCLTLLESVPVNPRSNSDFDALCMAEGFTIIECSRVVFDTGIRDPSDAIELINGMLFKPLTPVTYLGGSETILLAAKVEVGGREDILYKLIMEFEPAPIDVYRIR